MPIKCRNPIFSCVYLLFLITLSAFCLFWQHALAGGSNPTTRMALLVGVNDGGKGRTVLRYADSDAERLGQVLVELGGVTNQDRQVLKNVSRRELMAAIDSLHVKVAAQKAKGQRVEVIFYYSGHSDEEGLLIRGERIEWRDLQRRVHGIGSDVKLVIVDSCSSGVLTRTKGGVRRPAFAVDESSSTRGTAVLTSSSATEASQESDRIRGAFFTHYLIAGLRGAADRSRNGRVTLTAAYQYAFHETLARTEKTRAGPQHPSYDFQLVGTGDLVLTDMSAAQTRLTFSPRPGARYFVRNSSGVLLAEFVRIAKAIEVGFMAERLEIVRIEKDHVYVAEVQLSEGQHLSVDMLAWKESSKESAAIKGNEEDEVGSAGKSSLSQDDEASCEREADTEYDFQLLSFPGFNEPDSKRNSKYTFGLISYWNQNSPFLSVGFAGGWTNGCVHGLQGAGVFNYAGGNVFGHQVSGYFNYAGKNIDGSQLTTGVNIATGEDVRFQFGFGNLARVKSGVQIGVVNITKESTRIQIGIANVSRSVEDVQVGLVNTGMESEHIAIGFVNIFPNGIHHLDLRVNSNRYSSVEIRTGARRIYSIIGAAFRKTHDAGYLFESAGGIGAEWKIGESIRVSGDLASIQRDLNSRGRARVIADWSVYDSVAVSLMVGIESAELFQNNKDLEDKSFPIFGAGMSLF